MIRQLDHRSTTELHAKLMLDQGSRHRARAQSKGRLRLSFILIPNDMIYLSKLGAGKLFRSALSADCFEGVPSSGMRSEQPIADAGKSETGALNKAFREVFSLHLLNRPNTNLLHHFGVNFLAIKVYVKSKYI